MGSEMCIRDSSFSRTATSRDGQRTVTAFQFPGAVVLSYLDLSGSRDHSRQVRRRIIAPDSELFVPETQLDSQPESVPSSIPSSNFMSVQAGIDCEDEDSFVLFCLALQLSVCLWWLQVPLRILSDA